VIPLNGTLLGRIAVLRM